MILRAVGFTLLIVFAYACADPNLKLREVEPGTVASTPAPVTVSPQATTTRGVPVERTDAPHATPAIAPITKTNLNTVKVIAGNEWTLVAEDDGVKTYRETHPEQDTVAFRGEVVIPTPLKNVAATLNDPDLRKEWVDSLLESRTIEVVNRIERIEYNLTKVPWPFQNRDFVYDVKVKVENNPPFMEIMMHSVEDARVPMRDGVVRGAINSCHYFMREQKSNEGVNTLVIVEMSVDPKGAIPTWLVNLAQKKWPHNTLNAMKRVASRPNLSIPKEIDDFFSHKTKGK